MNELEVAMLFAAAVEAVVQQLKTGITSEGGAILGSNDTGTAFIQFMWGAAAEAFTAHLPSQLVQQQQQGKSPGGLTQDEQFQALNMLDHLSDVFTAAGKETFSRAEVLIIIDNTRSNPEFFDPDVVIAQQIATAETQD